MVEIPPHLRCQPSKQFQRFRPVLVTLVAVVVSDVGVVDGGDEDGEDLGVDVFLLKVQQAVVRADHLKWSRSD